MAVVLHWTIAAFIIANLLLGFFMESFKPDSFRVWSVQLHQSFGFTVFALSLVRLAWRLSHPAPPLPARYPAWERMAAHAAQAALYVMMIGMPIVGWLILSANLRRPMTYFWAFVIPPFAPVNHIAAGAAKTALHDNFVELHTIGGWTLVALLALHVGAALKHQIWDKDPELQRMWFGPRRAPSVAPAE